MPIFPQFKGTCTCKWEIVLQVNFPSNICVRILHVHTCTSYCMDLSNTKQAKNIRKVTYEVMNYLLE